MKHVREIRRGLEAAGFEIVEVRAGSHLRWRAVKHGLAVPVTIASSPRDRDNAVANTVKQVQRTWAAAQEGRRPSR